MIIDKDNIKIILIILVLSLGIGYAYINSNLNINGTAQVNSATWAVHWANVQVSSGSVTGTNVITAPTIQNQTTVNFSIILPTPGTYYEFTVDAVNAGSIDAMIDAINYKLNGSTITILPAYLEYTVTYGDDIELEQNHKLAADTTETYKVKVKYRDDITLSQIPTIDQSLSLQFTVTYRQADNQATDVVRYLYGSSRYVNIHIGSSSSEIQGGEETPPEEENIYNDAFFRYNIRNDEVVGIDLGFIQNENYYYLKGGGATKIYDEEWDYYYYLNDSPYYEQNKQTLISAFGIENCSEYSEEFFVGEEESITYKTFSCDILASHHAGSATDVGNVFF